MMERGWSYEEIQKHRIIEYQKADMPRRVARTRDGTNMWELDETWEARKGGTKGNVKLWADR